ncbi:CDP-diacylglycerol--glycerol-3-phosphate 3-phosphatidyltransferase [Phycisphaerales bacterium AB-hyl4]|uniref:CDP-diacylglycerol--glycerol-3-phosphate 3-phosphatidyltransferase n=1 Tax=Natronomicrosphaera hydrolytica TaxID=3242702 RepID=A0ABV4U2Q4_9BACT
MPTFADPHAGLPMQRHLPNQLTLFRLVLAALFFVILNQYRYASSTPDWILLIAMVVFIVAALTDYLDGYLARKWQVESTFGRIMDPFCDKVLVIGAFIYLAGPRFVMPDAVDDRAIFVMVSGVYPWMVAIILARELLVTGVRGELEGKGIQFGANMSGKLKMVLQSVTVPVVLLIVFFDPKLAGHGWMGWVRDILVYLTVIVTLVSGIPYFVQAVRVMTRSSNSN